MHAVCMRFNDICACLLCCNRYFITVASVARLEYGCPHKSSDSLPVSNPIIHFEDLDADLCENLFAKMQELTKEINSKFKKLLIKVYESLRARHIDHSSVILTLTEDDIIVVINLTKLKTYYLINTPTLLLFQL